MKYKKYKKGTAAHLQPQPPEGALQDKDICPTPRSSDHISRTDDTWTPYLHVGTYPAYIILLLILLFLFYFNHLIPFQIGSLETIVPGIFFPNSVRQLPQKVPNYTPYLKAGNVFQPCEAQTVPLFTSTSTE